MPELTVSGDKELIADFASAPAVVTKAAVRALNRSIRSGNTILARLIAGDIGLKNADVKAAMRTTDANANNLSAQIAASFKRIPLIKFGARGPEPSRGKGSGVSYRLRGGRGRIASAFIWTLRSRAVFARVGHAPRGPLTELHGPSVGRVAIRHRPAALARVREVFDKNFAHEVGFAKSQDAGTD